MRGAGSVFLGGEATRERGSRERFFWEVRQLEREGAGSVFWFGEEAAIFFREVGAARVFRRERRQRLIFFGASN